MAKRTVEPAVPKPAKALKKKTKPEEAGQETVAVKVEPPSPAQAAGSKAAVEAKPEKGFPPPAKKAWNDMHYQMQQLEKKGKTVSCSNGTLAKATMPRGTFTTMCFCSIRRSP